jgi:hypothetical protein
VEARRGCHRRTAQCGSTDKEKWEVEYGDLKALLLQYGRQYRKELYNIDFDKVVSTEEELMDMLPRASPLVLAKQLRMRLEMCVPDENSKPTSFGRSRYWTRRIGTVAVADSSLEGRRDAA